MTTYYLYNEAGPELGPYNLEQLSDQFRKGELPRNKLVRTSDSADWQLLHEIVPEVPLYHLHGQPESSGPFTFEQLETKVLKGEIQGHDLVQFQGPNGSNWGQVSDVLKGAENLATAPLLTAIPPCADTHCFVNMGGSRQGPYVQEQIRGMWQSGVITADATVDWETCVRPLPVMVLLQGGLQQPNIAGSAPAETTDIFAIVCFATGLAGLLIMPIILTPIAYVSAMISHYRLKENPHLKGKGLRLSGAIFASLSLLWMWRNFRYGY